jgi:hypothetical protein
MVVVTEANRTPIPHGGGIRIGGPDAEVTGTAVAPRGGTLRVEPPLFKKLPGRITFSRYVLGIDGQRQDAWRQIGVGLRYRIIGLVPKQISHVGRGFEIEAGDEGRDARISFDLCGVEVQLASPDQAGLLAQVDDFLEEALEDLDPQPLSDAGQAGVIRQVFIEGIAQIPAMGQVEAGGCDELTLGADPLEEHHELQLEEDGRVEGGSAAFRIESGDPLADKAEVELQFQMAREVVLGDEILQGDGDGLVQAARFGGTEHDSLSRGWVQP